MRISLSLAASHSSHVYMLSGYIFSRGFMISILIICAVDGKAPLASWVYCNSCFVLGMEFSRIVSIIY